MASSYDLTRFTERDQPEDYRSYRSMNYGSLPPSLLTSKYEETDIGDEEERYDEYARGTLVDWGPDTVTFEHEKSRGGVNARSGRLQAQYYGHRGDADIPYQPERFDGFMGDEDRDPRGINVEPDMKELRKQHEARTRFIRWTPDGTDNVTGLGRSESKVMADQQTIFKLVRNRLKVFSRALDGRREGLRRTYTHASAADKQVRVQSYGDAIKDYALTPQRRAAVICREVIRGSRAWCDETADGDFAMARYTQHRRAARGTAAQDRVGVTTSDVKRNEAASAAVTYKACALLMSDIVKRKAQAASAPGDIDLGTSRAIVAAKTAPLERDLTHILRAIGQDAEFASGKITLRGKTASPVIAEHLARSTIGQASTPAHHALNAEIIYRAVRPGADLRSIKNDIVRDATAVDDEMASRAAKQARKQMVTGAKLARVEDAERADVAQRHHSYKTGRAASTKRMSTAYDQDATDSPLTQFRRQMHNAYRGPRQSDTVAGMKYGDNASGERHGGVMGSKYMTRSIDRDSASLAVSDM